MASCQLDGQNEFNPLSSLIHWHSLARQCANLLDGSAPFYRIYETKDKKFVAVGALEPHFYANLLRVRITFIAHALPSHLFGCRDGPLLI